MQAGKAAPFGKSQDAAAQAARRRGDITNFFRGSLVRSFIGAGPDNLAGTADDLFTLTGETLARIRDRVLPVGAVVNNVKIVDDKARVPLYLANPGFFSLNLQPSVPLSSVLPFLVVESGVPKNKKSHVSLFRETHTALLKLSRPGETTTEDIIRRS